jgi:polysaccharide biosynthesis protein PslG
MTNRRRNISRLVPLLAILALPAVAGAAPPSTPPGQAPPSNSAPPSISGSPVSGQTLTADAGTWSGATSSFTLEWDRCDSSGNSCAPVGGAGGSSYSLGSADVGNTLRVTVTATNKRGSSSASSAPTGVVATAPAPAPAPAPTSAPSNTALPQINGVSQQGQTLTASTGTWAGTPTSYAYQWNRCDTSGNSCNGISGATAQSYALAAGDVGATMRVVVAATNSGGTASVSSTPTAVVTGTTVSAPVDSTLPTISGSTQVGQNLTASTGTWSGSPTAYAFQWKRCDSTGAACSDITGATAATYLLASVDASKTMRVSVTASSSTGSAIAISSATTAIAALATASTSRFGIAAGGSIQNLSSTDLAKYLDSMKAAGAGWLRFDINWDVIQYGGPSSYNWAPFDAVVNAARARGLQLLGTILYTPPWARAAGTSPQYPPTNLSDYSNFAKLAAQHFGSLGVHAYEIWNEPNISFWLPSPDPVRYTSMLKLAYAAIKQSDSTATVVSAGLSPYGSYGQSDAGHMNPINFLEQMYAAGAKAYMDAVGWHPYNYPYGLGYAGWSAWSQMSATSPSARSVMTANGDSAKQIWLTEFGEPTGSSTRAVTDAAQAQFVTDAYSALKLWSWAGPAFLYSFRDVGTDLTNIEDNFGIIHNDWSLKPAYSAYQTAAAAG